MLRYGSDCSWRVGVGAVRPETARRKVVVSNSNTIFCKDPTLALPKWKHTTQDIMPVVDMSTNLEESYATKQTRLLGQ